MNILGKSSRPKPKSKTVNQVSICLEELENAFRFFAERYPEKEIFIEHDELTAAGPAYKEQGPLSMLDVLSMLEKLSADFERLIISSAIIVIRKRLGDSSGVVVENDDKQVCFMKDATLKTFNFLDFYNEILKPQLSESDGKIIEINPGADSGVRVS